MSNPITFCFKTLQYNCEINTNELFGKMSHSSGVFRIFDIHGSLIILEKTNDLAHRIRRFFSGEDTNSRAVDLKNIASKIEYCRTDSPMESLYLLYCERRKWFPTTYRNMRTFAPFHMIKINRGQRFPRIYATKQIKQGVEYFGPFRSRSHLDRLKTTLERTFKLRPCQYNIRGNDPYPDCLYFQMRSCSKPCNGDIDRDTYLQDIDQAIAFIEGKDDQISTALIKQLEGLALQTKFEEAERFRKQLNRVTQARKDHKETYLNLKNFDFVAVMNAKTSKKRKLAFINEGSIRSMEEYTVEEILKNLNEILRQKFETVHPIHDRERQYDEFCLVSTFMTKPVQSVNLTHVGDRVEASKTIFDNLLIKERESASSN